MNTPTHVTNLDDTLHDRISAGIDSIEKNYQQYLTPERLQNFYEQYTVRSKNDGIDHIVSFNEYKAHVDEYLKRYIQISRAQNEDIHRGTLPPWNEGKKQKHERKAYYVIYKEIIDLAEKYHGLNPEQKFRALLTDQKALIWTKYIQERLDSSSVQQSDIEESYAQGVKNEIIDTNKVPLDEYISECPKLLALYINLTRAQILEQKDVISLYGGEGKADDLSTEIGTLYLFLIEKLIDESIKNSTGTPENKTPSNVTHILSAES